MLTVKVGRRGQITVPRKVRQALDLKEGDGLAFIIEENQVVLQPISQTLLDLRGSIPVKGPQDFAEIRKQVTGGRGKRQRDEG
jgi:AbrB family looped-hinge helix DNA binding protein